MLKIFLIFPFFIFWLTVFAQLHTNDGCIIKGCVIDSATGNPIEFASISIHKMPQDSLVAGTLSNSKGNFIKENLNFGTYQVNISFIGFKMITLNNIVLSQRNNKALLGKIKVSATLNELKDVTIIGAAKQFEQTFDKKIFTMDEKRAPGALNVLDQLKTLPSISVDPDGNVTFRGQTPNILVDDQPYYLLYPKLEMIPSSNVEKIEFIEPSARYESSSATINIILKRPKENGLSGTLYSNLGFQDFNSISQNYNGLNINYKYKKAIIFSNLNYSTYNYFSIYDRSVILNFNNEIINSNSSSHTNSNNYNISEGAGVVYTFDKKRKLTLTWTPSKGHYKSESTAGYNENDSISVREKYLSVGNSDNTSKTNSFSLNFNKKYANELKELSLKANLSIQNSNGNSLNDRKYSYFSSGMIDSLRRNETFNKDNSSYFSLSTFFTYPIDTLGRWETGYQLSANQASNKYDYFLNGYKAESFSNNQSAFTSGNSVYTRIGTRFKKIKIDGGIRLSVKTIDANIHVYPNGNDSVVDIKKLYPLVIPNISFRYEIKPFHEITLNYSFDKQIPYKSQLNPYINKSDPRNWSAGNNSLEPEKYHRISFGYIYAPDKYSISIDAFANICHNDIENITLPLTDNIYISKPYNAARTFETGITLSASAMPVVWFNANFSADLYRNTIDASRLPGILSSGQVVSTGLITKSFSFMANGYVSFTIKQKNSISLSVYYDGKDGTLGGYSKPRLYNSVYFSRKFLKKMLNVNLSISNVIDNMSSWGTTREYFGRKENSDYSGSYGKRTFTIGIRYYFNQGDRGLLNNQNVETNTNQNPPTTP